MNKLELLAPAGDLEKLKIAVQYGADAVYLGGEAFGLRAQAANFDPETMNDGLSFAHSRGKKVYVTVNVIPHNGEIDRLPRYLEQLKDARVDGIILADLGVLSLAKKYAPGIPLHVSVQANVTNFLAAKEWATLGASRIVVSRELSLVEISRIRRELPSEIELEAFVHGAMCLSYSGRCYLSSYLTNRDANHGECTQPCRWKYALVEEKRPGQYLPVAEEPGGAYILNTKDLCMIEHIPEMADAGISSFKIEGRAKTAFYVAGVVRAYRSAIDAYCANPSGFIFDKKWMTEVEGISHREYSTGFYLSQPDGEIQYTSAYLRQFELMAVVKGYNSVEKRVILEQRNRFCEGDLLEALTPDGEVFYFPAADMRNKNGLAIKVAPHAQMELSVALGYSLPNDTMIRKKV